MKYIVLALFSLALVGCTSDIELRELDRAYLIDVRTGKCWQPHHNMGDNFYMRKSDNVVCSALLKELTE